MKKDHIYIIYELTVKEAKILNEKYEHLVFFHNVNKDNLVDKLNKYDAEEVLCLAEQCRYFDSMGFNAHYLNKVGVLEEYTALEYSQDDELVNNKGCTPLTVLILSYLLALLFIVLSVIHQNWYVYPFAGIFTIIAGYVSYKIYKLEQ